MDTNELKSCLFKNFGLVDGTYIYTKNDDGTITIWQCPILPECEKDFILNLNIDFENRILEDIKKTFDTENKLCSLLMKTTIDIEKRRMLNVEMVQKSSIYESVCRECRGNSSGLTIRCGNGKTYFISVEIIPD